MSIDSLYNTILLVLLLFIMYELLKNFGTLLILMNKD